MARYANSNLETLLSTGVQNGATPTAMLQAITNPNTRNRAIAYFNALGVDPNSYGNPVQITPFQLNIDASKASVAANNPDSGAATDTPITTSNPPSFNQSLDPIWLNDYGNLNNTYNNSLNQLNLATQAGDQDYATALQRLARSQGLAQHNQVEDFAGRGLYGSGIFQKAQDNLNTDYTNQNNDLVSDQSRFDANQVLQQTALANQRDQAYASALGNALARYNTQYGTNVSLPSTSYSYK